VFIEREKERKRRKERKRERKVSIISIISIIRGFLNFHSNARVNHERFHGGATHERGRGYFVIIREREIVHGNFPEFRSSHLSYLWWLVPKEKERGGVRQKSILV
jgi:hypothetical protein